VFVKLLLRASWVGVAELSEQVGDCILIAVIGESEQLLESSCVCHLRLVYVIELAEAFSC
jgi:hypothetical protein